MIAFKSRFFVRMIAFVVIEVFCMTSTDIHLAWSYTENSAFSLVGRKNSSSASGQTFLRPRAIADRALDGGLKDLLSESVNPFLVKMRDRMYNAATAEGAAPHLVRKLVATQHLHRGEIQASVGGVNWHFFFVRSEDNNWGGPFKGGFRYLFKDSDSLGPFKEKLAALTGEESPDALSILIEGLTTWVAEEGRALSKGMTFKNKLVNLPLGGGKATLLLVGYQKDGTGQVTKVKAWTSEELEKEEGALKEITKKIGEYWAREGIVGHDRDVPAPDVKTSGREMVWLLEAHLSTLARLKQVDIQPTEEEFHTDTPYILAAQRLNLPHLGSYTGKPIPYGGQFVRAEATGLGATYSIDVALSIPSIQEKLKNPKRPTVAINGAGNAALYGAIKNIETGRKVVAINDTRGALIKASGLTKKDLDVIQEVKNKKKSVVDATSRIRGSHAVRGKEEGTEAVLYRNVDILLLAGVEDAIHEENVGRVQAKVIAEAANGPITEEADRTLFRNGQVVIPDSLASAGGVIVSWHEMMQNDPRTPRMTDEDIRQDTQARIFEAFRLMWGISEAQNISLREAGDRLVVRRLVSDWQEAQRAKDGGDHILVEVSQGVATLTLNRPEALNSTTEEMIAEIRGFVREMNERDDVSVIVFKGSPAKKPAFNAGADIKGLVRAIQEGRPEEADRFYELEYATYEEISRSKKIVISLTDGWVIGSGMGLSRAGDFIIGTEGTRFMMPETGIGFFPDVGMSYYMPKRMGLAAAKYYGMTGESFNAGEARQLGWDVLVTPSERLDEVEPILRQLAQQGVFSGERPRKAILADVGKVLRTRIHDLALHQTLVDRNAFRNNKLRFIRYFFAGESLPEIFQRLQHPRLTRGVPFEPSKVFAEETLKVLRGRSPIALSVTNHLFNLGSQATLQAAFQNELYFAARLSRHPDYIEGVDATLGVFGERREARFTPVPLGHAERQVHDWVNDGGNRFAGYIPPDRIHSASDYDALRERFLKDPVDTWGRVAARYAKWFNYEKNAWVSYNAETNLWEGYDANTGEKVSFSLAEDYAPWTYTFSWFDRGRKVWKAFNIKTRKWEEFERDPDDLMPLFKYFDGGKTNLTYNALDVHVLNGEGNRVIDTVELEPTDTSGHPTEISEYTYREILTEVAKFTDVLKKLGLQSGDKIALNIPNGIEWKIVALAAARLGLTYTPPFALRGANEVRDQMKDLGARVLVTIDGYFHAGVLNHHKTEKVDVALEGYDGYFHVNDVHRILQEVMASEDMPTEVRERVMSKYEASREEGGFGGKELITTQREALEAFLREELLLGGVIEADQDSVVRKVFAKLQARSEETSIQKVVVFQRAGKRTRLNLKEGRDLWAHEAMKVSEASLYETASRLLDRPIDSKEAFDALSDEDFMKAISQFAPAVLVSSEHPLFAIYTSGSTGKPKGALHTTAGYMIGLKYAINLVQHFDSESVFMVYADPGWITGQSAGLYAPYLAGLPSITYQGALNQPNSGRLLDILERYGVTHFKAGAPVLRGLRAAGSEAFQGRDLKVTECINCAEPGDSETQSFLDAMLGDGTYVNNLWRTEDGFEVFGTTPFGVPQALDASVYQLPYAQLEVVVEELDEHGEPTGQYRVGKPGELGYLLAKVHPYMVRTLWGDEERFLKTYWDKFDADAAVRVDGMPSEEETLYGKIFPDWHLVGDAGRKAEHDGRTHFIIPGRTDDVINVSGNRIGTRDIEAGLIAYGGKDAASDGGRKVVAEAAAIGIKHPTTGETPIAFVKLQPGVEGTDALDQRLRTHLERTLSPHYRPSEIFYVTDIPLTLSGKNMRRFLGYVGSLKRREMREVLRKLNEGGEALEARIRAKDQSAIDELFPGLGNITSLANPESIIETVRVVAEKRYFFRGKKAEWRATRREVDPSIYRPITPLPELIDRGDLLPEGFTIIPGLTLLPDFMRAKALVKGRSGAPYHDEPKNAIQDVVVRVPELGEDEYRAATLYLGGTYNVVWGALGVPVSVFDGHDEDYHILGSGGVSIVTDVGAKAAREGKMRVGDLIFTFPFKTDALSATAGADLSFAGPAITGFETPDGMAGEFHVGQVQNAFVLPSTLPPGLTYAHLAQLSLDLPTVWKAIVYAAQLKHGERMFMEGAAGGTGIGGVVIGNLFGGRVTGLVSSPEKANFIREHGATAALNRKDEAFEGVWTGVPEDPSGWEVWEKKGRAVTDAFKAENDGKLADVIVSHAGRDIFGRDVQLLSQGGRLTFYGASSGYNLSFMGKKGVKTPGEMFDEAGLKPSEGVLIYYGNESDLDDEKIDRVGIEAIEAALSRNARVVVVVQTNAQESELHKRFGKSLKGVVSIERMELDPYFEWREMPDADQSEVDYEHWEDFTFKPLGIAVGNLLKTRKNPRGNPHLIFERASQNRLGLSSRMAMPYFGRIVYSEKTEGRRYSFYAPNVWMHQKDILFPDFKIIGTHMANAHQVEEVVERVLRNELPLPEPTLMESDDFAEGMQAVRENRHQGSLVFRFGAPEGAFRNQADLLKAMQETPEELADQTFVKVSLLPVSGEKSLKRIRKSELCVWVTP